MIFDRIAELKIREAITEGKFDNLPNAGQPIDLEDYFRTPPEMRLASDPEERELSPRGTPAAE